MNIVFQEKIMIKGILIGLAIIVVVMTLLVVYSCLVVSSENEDKND